MSATLVQLSIVDDQGNKEKIGVRMRDVLLWEKRFRGRGLFMLEQNVHLEYLYELAFIIAQRSGLPATETFGAPDQPGTFCGTYDIEQVEETGETVDPTQEVPSTGASSDLPSSPSNPSSTGNPGLIATNAS